MNQYGVGQDEFIFRMYSIALVAIASAATVNGDLYAGLTWILQPGTYDEQINNVPLDQRSWSPTAKMALMVLFSTMGFFGSSCSAAITKQFGALTMSITSTARKATTLFLSFLLFDNECTYQHFVGILVFISALTAKSVRRKGKKRRHGNPPRSTKNVVIHRVISDLEIGGGGPPIGGISAIMGGTTDNISRTSSRDFESGGEESTITSISMDSSSRLTSNGGGPGRRNNIVSSSSRSPQQKQLVGNGVIVDHHKSRPRYHVV
jgi:hypothetical protein